MIKACPVLGGFFKVLEKGFLAFIPSILNKSETYTTIIYILRESIGQKVFTKT